ncbi:helix-turn-helix domain-containing protein [Arthrobacter cryoconiti]|uniref:Helix-turn-helix domain-containing protein n=1 Tax=Arthrobacter cryoconiti TaxID=748907 RepID=A0ABV8R538_9MICC|nr:helix-turn-helix transcriptional regulator [Arthrobacter cryoconiti]MCC9066741.1 helix-turn-helix domain-containing protein [Arthrobacter cryoconiti]
MSSLMHLLTIDHSSRSQLLGVELAKNDYRLVRDLIRLRKQLGVSQEQLADKMGVTQPTVSAFESMDSDPKLSTIRRYSKALGVLVTHKAAIADESSTVSAADGFTRAVWHTAPKLTIPVTLSHLSSFALAAPMEATRTDFALSA